MTTFSSTIYVDAPKDAVWTILADLGGIQKFHPGVRKSYYTTEQHEDVGAARVCELLPMGVIEEKAVEWKDGDYYVLTIDPLKKAPPFKKAYGRLATQEEGTGTRVTMTLDYTLKFGPLGKLLDAAMVRPRMQKVVPTVLLGLKHYAETGEEVTSEVIRAVQRAQQSDPQPAQQQLNPA